MNPVISNSSFRCLWLGGLLSSLGSQIGRIGLILFVFKTSESVTDLALLVTLEALPGALAAPLVGAFVDGSNKRAVMVASDLARAGLVACVLFSPTPGVIYLATALHSVLTVLFQAARGAAVPLIVAREDLVRANGVEQGASNLTLILGPVVGAELFYAYGLAATLLTDAASFLLSAVLVSRVSAGGRRARRPATRSWVAEIREGWGYVAGDLRMLHLSGLFFVGLVCSGVWMPLAPSFIRDHIHAPERLFGWQLGVFGLGAIVGGAWAHRLAERYGLGRLFFAGLVGEASCLAAYALVPRADFSTAVLFVWGGAVSLMVVTYYSVLQAAVEERMAGRVFALVKQGENFALVLSMLLAVLLQGVLPSQLILMVAGLAYFVITVASWASGRGRALLVMQ